MSLTIPCITILLSHWNLATICNAHLGWHMFSVLPNPQKRWKDSCKIDDRWRPAAVRANSCGAPAFLNPIWGETRNAYIILVRKSECRDRTGNLGLDVRIILK